MTRPLLTNIQLLRFLAASAVLVGHAGDVFMPAAAWVRTVPWSAGVDIFFVISGFVMAYLSAGRFGKQKAWRDFLIRRIIRIAPPYWLFTLLMIAVLLILPTHVRHTDLTAGAALTSVLFVPWPRADGELNPLLSQGWTLNYEAFFYAAFSAGLLFRRGRALLVVAFLALAAINPLVPSSQFILKFWTQPIILEFVAGIALAQLHAKGVRVRMWRSIGLLLCAVALFLLTEAVDPGPYRRLVHAGFPAFLLCASLALAPEPAQHGPIRKWMIVGGDSSYTLYLSHTLTINAAAQLWAALFPVSRVIGMTFAIAAALLAAGLIHRWVERPMTDKLYALASKRKERGVAAVAP